ncbi:hypothetical protein [Haloarchaeobius sp. DT45]|uniref:hypothetical protein n=1 Tax=Haloarchaeobius sp. DT45 TaxID=3446116 RepID=UPI003F6D074C
MNRRLVLLAMAGVAVLVFATGTGGFSSSALDRGLTVNVVDDQRAYVGFEQSVEETVVEPDVNESTASNATQSSQQNGSNSTTTTNETDVRETVRKILVVRVENQLPAGTDLDSVRVTVDDETVALVDGALGQGEAAETTFSDVDCDDRITVAVSGDGMETTFTRPVECNSVGEDGGDDDGDSEGEGENEDEQGEDEDETGEVD